ncbi:hypothetical protein BAUCODRAFT_33559 [Baudoinia panamericana UAMH 10762]|uniref:Uncharacterized protein n=1 Tax=Baudoinia panamericana (strain UAMH 10762) TaxID=717646 RepID=M2MHV0_BAUPA|nr:uncharacterized protein BAUCODRAFT_33559 [Baudoinia panamericana UAMH 10762]EMC96211.1 hypothetical protein BAUCODRAFT_33559 [Baudoinia panamericana UAMH 10762]
MATYQIQIANRSGTMQEYVILHEPPEVALFTDTNTTTPVAAFSLPWIKSSAIPVNGMLQVDLPAHHHAVCGTLSGKKLAAGVVVTQTDDIEVFLATDDDPGSRAKCDLDDAGKPEMYDREPDDGVRDGAFGIEMKPYDGDKNSYIWLGYGKKDLTTGVIVPMASWPSTPDAVFGVTPSLSRWRVGTGQYGVGQAVGGALLSSFALIDFATAPDGQTVAGVMQGTDGIFRTTFQALSASKD